MARPRAGSDRGLSIRFAPDGSRLQQAGGQNQNLAESDADLAQDLRRETYEMLQQGKTPQQVSEFMVARYGDFVLYRPQFKSSTYLLWLGPFLLLVVVLVIVGRRLRASAKPVEVDADALADAKQLLEKDTPEK
jgi:cytochrome c-type biogenesis protein CcmH